MNNPYQQYQHNSIFTAPAEELTLMLYEGGIKFINKATFLCDKKDLSGANEALKRVQAIISELDSTLNNNYRISKNLHLLYDYIQRRIIDANINKDTEIMKEVSELITDLRDTWKEAMVLAKKQR